LGISRDEKHRSTNVHSGEDTEGLTALGRQARAAESRVLNREYRKQLLRKRGEPIERSFAHCCDTAGMGRTHLRGHENILKRLLLHVGAFNLSLIFRSLLGAGTPRELRNRLDSLFRLLFSLFLRSPASTESANIPFPSHESTDGGIFTILVTYSVIRKNLIPPRAAREGKFPIQS